MASSPALLIPLLLSSLALAGCSSPAEVLVAQEAIQIPPMDQTPSLDKHMGEEEWAQSVQVNGTFVIADGSKADGVYPFRLWIGATEDGLAIAAEIENGTNPFNTENERWADALYLFFKTDEAPGLTSPSYMIAGFTEGASTWTAYGFWNGKDWERDPTDDGGELDEDHRPFNGTWVRAGAGEGTTFFELYTPRFPAHGIRNSLHLTPGSEFRMGLAYMRGGSPDESTFSPDARGRFHWPHDAHPGEGYTPHGMYHPDDWLRFRVP